MPVKNIPIHSFLVDDESSIPFQLVQLTKEGSYDTSVPHRHNYYEVFIFEIGGGEHNIDFRTFPLQNHSIHFVSPGQVHNVIRKEDSNGFVVLFSRDFYSSNQQRLRQFPFLNNNSTEPILNLSKEEFSILRELITNIKRELKLEYPESNELIKAYLNTFLIHCKRFYNTNEAQKTFSNDSLSFIFKHMIEENYLQIHSVSDYAKKLNCSEKQLATATKKELGVSPKVLIDERIILEAKRLVLHTMHSLQEIAFFLNYTDASHFAKFFKSKTGVSPGQFRENGEKYP
jgi:AraC-like DNA-binding protein